MRSRIESTAKELYLAGSALIVKGGVDTPSGNTPASLIYVEGGTRGVHKFVKLLMQRIDWNSAAAAVARAALAAARRAAAGGATDDSATAQNELADESESSDDDSDSDAGGNGVGGARSTRDKGARVGGRCELLWRGTVARAAFHDFFRFEECKTSATARRVLESKGLAHAWDAVVHSAVRATAGDAL